MPVTRIICRQQLGDLLLHQPVFAHFAAQGPVLVNTRDMHQPLLALMPEVANSAAMRPDASVCFDSKFATVAGSFWPPGQQRTLIIPDKRIRPWQHWLFDHIVPFAKGSRYTALALFTAAGGREQDFCPPRLSSPPEAWRPTSLPKRYLLIHPTSAWERKCLSPDRWVAALASLTLPWPVVVSGGKSAWEIKLCRQLCDGIHANGQAAVNLAGQTSLRGYLSTVAHAEAVLCVDGSSSHLAAAFRRPCLTLFGPTHPVHWHWPTDYSFRLWAADHVDTPYPAAEHIPVDALRTAISRVLAQCPA